MAADETDGRYAGRIEHLFTEMQAAAVAPFHTRVPLVPLALWLAIVLVIIGQWSLILNEITEA